MKKNDPKPEKVINKKSEEENIVNVTKIERKLKSKVPGTKKVKENDLKKVNINDVNIDDENLTKVHTSEIIQNKDSSNFLKSTDESKIENYENLDREQLLTCLENIVQIQDVTEIKQKIACIKVVFLKANKLLKQEKLKTFIAEGGREEDFIEQTDEIEKKFHLLFDVYKQNKAKYDAHIEEVKIQNLELKKQVLEELKELINSEETLKKTYDEFNILQERWKEIGLVPQNEVNNLWQNYHFLVEMFFDKVKINKELRDLDLKKNMEAKIELCEKAEELLIEKSIVKSFKELQKLHENWKEIGPVPREIKEELWERFKTTTEKINKQRKEHYFTIHENQKKNLETKISLCEQTEELSIVELKTIKGWQQNTHKINELIENWRNVGVAPKKYNEEIWLRFKNALSNFFESKNNFFKEIKEKQINNYNLKLDLCIQAEALKDSTDWKEATDKLINIQKEWKKIGPVAKKYSDKIWKRFRASCDEFFEKKSKYFSNIKDKEVDNLKCKEELLKKIECFEFGCNKKENLKIFKNFQREWMEIGHVPKVDQSRIQKKFRKILDERINKLNIEETELTTLSYKTRFENLMDSKESRNILNRERNFLTSRISKMKDDIKLWENNMGFFANSKNADLLKVEFKEKIEKAKNEVLILEAKLRVVETTELA